MLIYKTFCSIKCILSKTHSSHAKKEIFTLASLHIQF